MSLPSVVFLSVLVHAVVRQAGNHVYGCLPIFLYECGSCKTLLRPKPGDCCVFCSYGSLKYPPIQAQDGCCS